MSAELTIDSIVCECGWGLCGNVKLGMLLAEPRCGACGESLVAGTCEVEAGRADGCWDCTCAECLTLQAEAN